MKKNCLIIIFLLLSLSLYSVEISIFFTNDTHGRILPEKLLRNLYQSENYTIGGAAYLANAKKKYQKEAPLNFLMDAGDIFEGAYITDKFLGKPQVEIMNQMGVDVFIPGNHDFAFGLDKLIEYTEASSFKTVCTNLVNKNYDHIFKPYLILKKENIKIGVLAFLTMSTPRSDNYTVINPYEIASYWKNKLEKKGVDLIVFLNHMGFDEDKKMAARFSPDIIISSHSHIKLDKPYYIGDTLIAQAGAYYRNLGHIKLEFEKNNLKNREYKVYDINSQKYSKDKEIQKIIDKYAQEVNPKMQELIGILPENFKRNGGVNSKLYKFLSNALIKEKKVDIAHLNTTGIRADLKKGEVLRRDVYNVLPFGNRAVVAKIKGENLTEDNYIHVPFKLENKKIYKVLTNSFIAGLSHSFKNSCEKEVLDEEVREIIVNYIRKNY
ncbi:MAG: bifunctional metallophosphatase/5'-nucleotidase [Candidatus Muiribacteriota bacterium]